MVCRKFIDSGIRCIFESNFTNYDFKNSVIFGSTFTLFIHLLKLHLHFTLIFGKSTHCTLHSTLNLLNLIHSPLTEKCQVDFVHFLGTFLGMILLLIFSRLYFRTRQWLVNPVIIDYFKDKVAILASEANHRFRPTVMRACLKNR